MGSQDGERLMTTCVRQAWLDLFGDGTFTVQLQNEAGGWFCTELDLGFPAVREVIGNRPDMDGADDRTRLMGSRAITANITALAGARARIDDVADNFAPFMVPSARPVLHYILDRPGALERTFTVRAANYAWPIAGPFQRDIQLAWVASDPIARDPNQQVKIAWAGSATSGGRTYPLTFNRVYPPGSGTANVAILASPGDVGIRPLIRLYGPITHPQLIFQRTPQGTYTYFNFVTGYILSAGQWVDIDALNHTVYQQSDSRQNMIAQVDWSTSTWPYVPPLPTQTLMSLVGSSTTDATQAWAMWNDGYLT